MSKKYYAVIRGSVNKPTIFKSWYACKKVVHGYRNSKFKSFKILEDALNYIIINTGITKPEYYGFTPKPARTSQTYQRKYCTVLDSIKNEWQIYDSMTPARRLQAESSKNTLKIFDTFDKAWAFASKANNKTLPVLKLSDISAVYQYTADSYNRICPICEKPHSCRTKCCTSCHKKRNEYGMSIAKLLHLKKSLKIEDIFDFLEKNPHVVMWRFNRNSVAKDRAEVLSRIQNPYTRGSQYAKWEGDYPLYIRQLFLSNPKNEFQTLSGSIMNPNIHYKCLACGEEHITKLKSLSFSHNCISTKPSGEVVVEEFLKNTCLYLVQYNTLKCLNPITGRQMPYDFELPVQKIIIEVQGDQHYEYTPYFHSNKENFEYQQFKDEAKRKFAEANGYKVIYINYQQIENGQYKSIIQSSI